MTQEITEEERRLAESPRLANDLGEDADAEPADLYDQESTDIELLVDVGGFEAVLGDDLQQLDLNEPGPEAEEEV